MSEIAVGIDLGTSYSCVSAVINGQPTVLPNEWGELTHASVVSFLDDGSVLVGNAAKKNIITNAENTVYSAKRLIGRFFFSDEVKKAQSVMPYKIVEGPNNSVRIQVKGRTFSLPEISALVLKEMKAIAESYLGQPVTKAVVTVPAYFNDNQRQATKDAGHIAGLDVLRIINEPTAAALAYGFGKNTERLIAVYDLGGGTFDISVLEIGGHGVFKVIATAGDTFLGGEDFDARVIDWLVQGFKEERGIDLRQDRMALQRLKDAAEKAKIELSALDEVEVNLPFITSAGRNEALHLQRALPRASLESLCGDLIERTIDICRQTLADARLPKEDVDEVILVGGMTRMPLVQRAVAQFFGREPSKGVHPDEVVALGAAIQGHALLGDAEEVLLLDVTPHALGIMTAGSRFEELIPQNTTVPTNRTKTFTTSRDYQTGVKILVLQGESEAAEQNELLGEFLLTGLRRAPRGQVEIEVTFTIDADGIVSVEATDLETGQRQSIKVTASSGLTNDEIASMIESAQEYGLAQKLSEEAERTLQEAETLVADLRSLLPRAERSFSPNDFGRDALNRARAALERAARDLGRRDHEALRDQVETLQRAQRMLRSLVTQGPAKGA